MEAILLVFVDRNDRTCLFVFQTLSSRSEESRFSDEESRIA